MTEDIEQLLKNLKLKRMFSVYDEQLRAAEKAQVSSTEFVAGLLRAQWHDRQESALEWRIRQANLPELWSLETFPWSRQPGINKKQMRAFAELDFVAKHENIVLVGPTSVGKTRLASALLLYDIPRIDQLTGKPTNPDYTVVVDAVARREKARLLQMA